MKSLQNALDAFPIWNRLGVSHRVEQLEFAFRSLEANQRKNKQKQMAYWQLENAKRKIAETQLMPGPTGEQNTLSAQGRGVFLVTISEALKTQDKELNEETISIGFVGQVAAALVAGNTVITTGQAGRYLSDTIANAITPFFESSLKRGVIQHVEEAMFDALLAHKSIAGVATLCNEEEAIQLQRHLAAKDGLICQLVVETDYQNLSHISKPDYLFNFITEQTVSNNTTAIGGNASLLELGNMTD